jgi:predicted nucleotidyltransferase
VTADAFDPAGILRALNARGVDYLLIGGFAVIAHGHLRATADVDVLPNPAPENMTPLAAALADLEARISGVDADLLGMDLSPATFGEGADFALTTRLGDVDVMQDVPGAVSYQRLADDAVATELDGVPVRVVSLDDLIALKRAADRGRDRDDLEALTEIARLRDSS